jgi:ABC-type proline/glycine betaine transport system permease subunit
VHLFQKGMSKLFSVVLALIAALFAVLAGVGVAVLVTHTYRFMEYSIFVTLLSAGCPTFACLWLTWGSSVRLSR